jgi:hypothetical protein
MMAVLRAAVLGEREFLGSCTCLGILVSESDYMRTLVVWDVRCWIVHEREGIKYFVGDCSSILNRCVEVAITGYEVMSTAIV